MPRRRVPLDSTPQRAFGSAAPDWTTRVEEAQATLQAINNDEITASPWIGLHYKHEFLLHYRHEFL
jgi:hypothetical protein